MFKKLLNLFLVFCLLSTSAIASSSYKSYSSGKSYSSSRSSYSSSRSSGYSGSSRSSSYSPSKSSSYSSTSKPSYSDTSYKSNSNTYKSGNSVTNNKPDNSFMGKIEQKIDNYENRNKSTNFAATSKPSSNVVKTSTLPTTTNNASLSSNKTYVGLAAAGVASTQLGGDSQSNSTFASTSKPNVNNDNSSIIKPSVNSPPAYSNQLSANKTYVNLSNTKQQQNTQQPEILAMNNQKTQPYNVTNYNNTNYNNGYSGNNGGGLTNTLVNYMLISSLMGDHNSKPTVINNYTTPNVINSNTQPQQNLADVNSNSVQGMVNDNQNTSNRNNVVNTPPSTENNSSNGLFYSLVVGGFVVIGLLVWLILI